MSARQLIWLALAACTAPLATNDTRADAQTAALTGGDGGPGPAGETGALTASTYFEDVDGALTLRPPSSCSEGDLLMSSSAGFSCAPDASRINRIAGGPGFSVSGSTLSARLGATAQDFAPVEHSHAEQAFTGTALRPIVTIDNTRNVNRSLGVWALSTSVGAPLDNPPVTTAGVVARNIAPSSGYGMVGDSYTQNVGGSTIRQGVAGFAGGEGAYATVGVANGEQSVGVHGIGGSATAVGVYALSTANGQALKTRGRADFSLSSGVILPLRIVSSSNTSYALASCDGTEIAIGGGCNTAGNIDFLQLVGPDGDCPNRIAGNSVDRGGVVGFSAYCCHAGTAVTVTADVQCLKVTP